MNYRALKVDFKARAATVSLNRPDLRNAFDAEMIREITECFRSLSTRDDLSVVILRGEGKSFSAGADLAYMKSQASFSLEENQRDAEGLYEMFQAVRLCAVPVIARVHGHAMGGALGLTACADVAAAVLGTQFCFSEVKLGLAPAVISSFVLEKMRHSFARRYMLSGEIFDANAAREGDLVQFSGDEAAVDQFVSQLTSSFLQSGPEALRATKELLNKISSESDWNEKRTATTRVIAERRVSPEGQDGLKAFFEKRNPSWRP